MAMLNNQMAISLIFCNAPSLVAQMPLRPGLSHRTAAKLCFNGALFCSWCLTQWLDGLLIIAMWICKVQGDKDMVVSPSWIRQTWSTPNHWFPHSTESVQLGLSSYPSSPPHFGGKSNGTSHNCPSCRSLQVSAGLCRSLQVLPALAPFLFFWGLVAARVAPGAWAPGLLRGQRLGIFLLHK